MTGQPPPPAPRRFPKLSATQRITILAGLLALSVFICVQRFRLESDLLAFLPTNDQAPQLEVSRNLMRGPLKQALIINVVPKTASHAKTAREVARNLAHSLTPESGIEKVAAGPDPAFEREVFDLYFPRRFLFTQTKDSESSFWDEENLRRKLQTTKGFLASPASSVYRPLLPQDPLLLFHERLNALSTLQPQGLSLEDGQFAGADGVAFIFARTKSALSFEQKKSLIKHINDTFADLRGTEPLTLEMSGALPFEVEGEEKTREDMSRVSTVSLIAIVLLSWLLFRGFLPLLLIFLPIFSGMLVACAATLLTFGEIHGLTLAFGAALLGVGMDYPLHLFNDQALHQDSSKRALARVRPGLYVGCGTTLAGFLAFGATNSPALAQVAVFTSAGLLTSLLVTLWILPVLPVRVGDGKIQRRLVAACDEMTVRLEGRRAVLIGTLIATSILAIAAIILAPWDTSTVALNPASAALRDADTRVRERLGLSEEILVVRGESPQLTLAKNHELSIKLQQLKQKGQIESFSSLSALYLPEPVQEQNRVNAASGEARRELQTALAHEEFSAEAFAPTFSDMAAPIKTLSLDELRRGPLAELVEPFWINLNQSPVALTRVSGPQETVKALAASDAAILRYNPSEFLEAALSTLTRSLRTVLLLGGAMMLVIVVLRHRRFHPSAVAFFPAAFAALGTLAIHGTFFGPLHLFHVLASLIVLSMGIDYGAFLVEAKGGESLPWPSLIGAALSTMASFGTLALSSVPALHALGGIIFVGILLALVMTLILSTFLEKKPSSGFSQIKSASVMSASVGTSALFLILLTACSSNTVPPAQAQPDTNSSSPQTEAGLSPQELQKALLSPAELPRIFWQQRLTIRFADQTHKISAIIQNDGKEFQVLALGPANTRLFLITQREKVVRLQMFVDRKVNLDPALLILDIQRALFWFPAGDPPSLGPMTTSARGFCALDFWGNSGIESREIADTPGSCEEQLSAPQSGLVIRYEPAYRLGRAPQRVTLTHRHRAYSIVVEHLATQEIPQ